MVKKIIYGAIAILLFGAGFAASAWLGRGDLQRERERIDQVRADLQQAQQSEQRASERADKLQGELDAAAVRFADLQRRLDEMSKRLDGSLKTIDAIAGGLDRAAGGADDSQRLLDEGADILRDIRARGRTKD